MEKAAELIKISLKLLVSRFQEVNLAFLILFSYFDFIFDLFFFILFLELGLGVGERNHAVTQQVTSDDMVTSHIMHGRT